MIRDKFKSQKSLVFRIILTALIALIAISLVRESTSRARDRALLAAKLQASIESYSALEWKMSADNVVTADEMSELSLDENRTRNFIRDYDKLDSNRSETNPFKKECSEYFKSVNMQISLFRAGKIEEAHQLDKEQTDPEFDKVSAKLIGMNYTAEKSSNKYSSFLATFVTLILLISIVLIAYLILLRDHLQNEMAWHSAIQESEKQVQERTNSYLRYAVDALFEVSSDGYIIFSTPAAEYQWGYPKNDLLGKPITDLVMPEEVDELCALLDEIRKERGRIKVVEHMMRMGDGSWQPCEIIAVGIRDNLFPDSVTLTCRNISERRSYQEQLNFQAYHDPLTKLPNRVFFTELLQNAIERASRSKENVGVIMLDLDNFKFINDTIDHVSGDLLLMHVGNRLQACARPGDTVARWAGDEFIMLLSDVDEETIVAISERIVSVLKAAAYVGGRDVYMTASMGAALSAQGMREADDLLRDVDSAMHQAKARGKDQIVFFDTAMNMIMVKRWELENDLRKALDNKEFRLFYQPIVSLDTGVMVEVEALIRWMHPEKGMICPSDFIPLAEENGLICSIGRWVLYEACRQGNEWRRSIPRIPPLVISVNLSARQLQEPKLLEEINMAVEQSGFSPDLLKIEITESATMEEGQETITKLDSIRQLGIRLAVDDFGTGYSSMSYLSSLPIDTLKIDRSFIAKMMSSMDDGAIVEAIVSLGKMLHMSITCEGIETREEAIKLRALGSDRGQGYYFGRPVPAEEITNTLQSGKLFAIDPSESDDFIDSSADRFSI